MDKPETDPRLKELDPIDAYWIPTPSGIRGFKVKVYRKLRKIYRKLFRNRNYILVTEGPFYPVANPTCDFARYDSFDDIPDSIKNDILINEGKSALDGDCFEMKHGAMLWVATIDGHVASRKLIRRGKDFKQWFVDLAPNDIVAFRSETYPKYRGRGIASSLTKHLRHSLLEHGGKAYGDININNIPSLRSSIKTGSKIVAIMKPISRKKALGVDK